jgi:methylated-DNA-protein-cysteine methyltransferase-like protein
MPAPPPSKYRLIYAVVSKIPKGRVATYGQVAELAGLPRQARLVGYALNVLPPNTRVPWHRVINSRGQVSLRSNGLGHDHLQAELLKREGVRFVDSTVSLPRFRWSAAVKPMPRRETKKAAARVGASRGFRGAR